MSEALKEAREYRDPTCPICEGEGCQCPGEETIEEGFASDAQRRAAFAQGYKAKGKKKKKDTFFIWSSIISYGTKRYAC